MQSAALSKYLVHHADLACAPGATPGTAKRAIAGVSSTPAMGSTPRTAGMGATPLRTPVRDALGLNDPDSVPGESTRQEARAREALLKRCFLVACAVPYMHKSAMGLCFQHISMLSVVTAVCKSSALLKGPSACCSIPFPMQ